ncbi:MAG: addiction module toxin RelE [Streptococcaceae bacterium]|jgi:mRNA interferase RelE/StbE|nr:addiction module toxin RelE [Streptococcaceae bacterium]
MKKIKFNPHSKKEYQQLEGSQKVFVNKGFDKIKANGMNVGERLHGGLSDCNKLKNKKFGLRIVFREVEGDIEIIEIVAIGKRDKKEVYKNAEIRLEQGLELLD